MLLLVIVLKALAEVAIFAMLGQGILYVFAGANRERNLVYRVFATVNRPVLRATRFITPRFIVDQHIWMVAILLLGVVWFALVLAKVHYFIEQGARAV